MKQIILNVVKDLSFNFLYYDRKNDEELSSNELKEALKKNEVTVDEIVAEFKKNLDNYMLNIQ